MRSLLTKIYDAFADTAAVLTAWLLLVFADWFVASSASLRFFAGPWEVVTARVAVAPLAYLLLAPFAPLVVLFARFAGNAPSSRAVRGTLVVLGLSLGGALGYGVSFGRHFHATPIRLAFVVVIAVLGGVSAYALAKVPLLLTRAPVLVGAVAFLFAAGAYTADATVLPRLYPAFHLALFALTLGALAVFAAAFREGGAMHPTGAVWGLPFALIFVSFGKWNAHRAELSHAPNLKIVLAERAPVLGRSILALQLFHPDPEADRAEPAGPLAVREEGRHLDWAGENILLISIDALRADHVGAYGYPRPVTPNIDRLAKAGALFEHAYCPTPHTSYSVTSMMTGKYMRPILLLGQGEDSETWAGYLRTYGYRTAAFFPPAVFFVDGDRFSRFSESKFGFEYAKVEFAPAGMRVSQVDAYLQGVKDETPLFLWVHLFEPHEPYELHEEFAVLPAAPTADVTAYDSEVSASDSAVGKLVSRVRRSRPNTLVIVTADHGEEFGEHGGRYHGTTVYEEQVRVPLIIEGPGISPARLEAPVQTIDLLPTVLSSLGIPRPARVRGNDLGRLLSAGANEQAGAGFAFAETDEYTLIAKGEDRLICARRVGACSLFDVSHDGRELGDTSEKPGGKERVAALRKLLRETERGHGTFEAAYSLQWPEALRRGIQGERDAAEEIVPLLDDANVNVRRKAAEVLFSLRVAEVWQGVHHACEREDDAEVKRWCLLIGVRTSDLDPAPLLPLLHEPTPAVRRSAALALAARRVPAASEELVAWWREEAPPRGRMPLSTVKELLDALTLLRVRAAVPVLLASLSDVRARPYIASALGKIGDTSARASLAAAFSSERYVTTRPPLAEALLELGAGGELRAPLLRFAGLSPPMREAIRVASRAKLLDAPHGGWSATTAAAALNVTLTAPAAPDGLRLMVLAYQPGGELTGDLSGEEFRDGATLDGLHVVELASKGGGPVRVNLSEAKGISAVWLLAHTLELPPPPKEPWHEQGDGGTDGL